MKIGFIGTGTIASAIVSGLCIRPSANYSIRLSPRNERIAGQLAITFPQVIVASSNQNVVDQSEIVFLSVRPQVAQSVLSTLRFKADHQIISLIATYSVERIAALVGAVRSITCAVPLPTVAFRQGPTAVFPSNAAASRLFDELGGAIEARTEDEFLALWSVTATMASYFELLHTFSTWLVQHGVAGSASRDYVSRMFQGLGEVPRSSTEPLNALAEEFKTKGGLNEQFAAHLARRGVFEICLSELDSILRRISGR